MTDDYAVFTEAYETGKWGDKGNESGPGSMPGVNMEYLNLLQTLINCTSGIKTILDIGCGDWRLMRSIDLRGKNYLGLDVTVPLVVENRKKYGSPTVTFELGNTVYVPMPEADLVIIKDVLQHISNAHAQTLLRKAIQVSKWVLVTNDYLPENGPDIANGEHRSLNICAPPFNVKGLTLASYEIMTVSNTMYTKRTILISGQRLGS